MIEWYKDELKGACETEDEDEVQGSEGRQRTIRKIELEENNSYLKNSSCSLFIRDPKVIAYSNSNLIQF